MSIDARHLKIADRLLDIYNSEGSTPEAKDTAIRAHDAILELAVQAELWEQKAKTQEPYR